MPKIQYQEIVTPDISENGTVTHEWILDGEGRFVDLYHRVDGICVKIFRYGDAIRKWKELCPSK